MNILWMMIPISLLLGVTFVITFIYLVNNGQYDDLESPPNRMLIDDDQQGENRA